VAAESKSELESFHRFLGEQLAGGGADLTPEECLDLWQTQRRERAETMEAIRQGLSDIAAGRLQSLEDFDRDFRTRHHIAPEA
jgi:uncharacterized protein with von Willebrand factor type A (vWA) domain